MVKGAADKPRRPFCVRGHVRCGGDARRAQPKAENSSTYKKILDAFSNL